MAMPFRTPLRRSIAALVLAPSISLLPSAVIGAGAFSVSPIRADLTGRTLSETITVTNDGAAPLRVNVKLMRWTQDDSGQDVLTESEDLVYFPRQLEIPAGTKKLVRVGSKGPAQGAERAYRLFIEESPPLANAGPAAVSFFFRFGVPVFVSPPSPPSPPDIPAPVLDHGKLSLAVRSTGPRHFRAAQIRFTDNAGWRKEVGGWYSLAGSQRIYEAEVPPDVCRKATRYAVTVESEDGTLTERTLDANPSNCS
jgi:fimbrial chaperone protein